MKKLNICIAGIAALLCTNCGDSNSVNVSGTSEDVNEIADKGSSSSGTPGAESSSSINDQKNSLNFVLNNQQGYHVAVIVNDIGEVNIDQTLIEKGGNITKEDSGKVVPLSNGCICCSLKTDLLEQIAELLEMNKFDYILIEASGICEPIPIAQTICMAGAQLQSRDGRPLPCHLDNIVSVVDVARLADEFAGGQKLLSKDLEEEDIANLLIQQIEFCNTIVMNKVDSLSKTDLEHVKAVVRALQPEAKMIETNYGKVEMKDILDTKQFDFEKVGNSAAWAKELMKETSPEDEDDDHDEHDLTMNRIRLLKQALSKLPMKATSKAVLQAK